MLGILSTCLQDVSHTWHQSGHSMLYIGYISKVLPKILSIIFQMQSSKKEWSKLAFQEHHNYLFLKKLHLKGQAKIQAV